MSSPTSGQALPTTGAADNAAALRRLLGACSIGTFIEWYDFFLFASAAVIVFNQQFFPHLAPMTGVLLSLMTYSVGFVTRPLGGVVFGYFGDRFGRKTALVWSLLLMGGATFAIGLVPNYAAIGVLAPALLVVLRIVQGLAVGGEMGGAILMVNESLDSRRRGFWTAWPLSGAMLGSAAAAGIFSLLVSSMAPAAFASWGWRIAFYLAAILVAIGMWMRLGVEESPVFQRLRTQHAAMPAGQRPSLGSALMRSKWQIVATLVIRAGENTMFYVFLVFGIVYLTRIVAMPRSAALNAVMIASIAEAVALPFLGMLSDRIGRRPMLIGGFALALIWSFFIFQVMASATLAAAALAISVGLLAHGVIAMGEVPYFVEAFPTGVRYTGFSIGYQLGSLIAGATAPFIGVALVEEYHSTLPISIYCLVLAIPALIVAVAIKETHRVDLAAADPAAGNRPVGSVAAEASS